jgi:hypothetical protein
MRPKASRAETGRPTQAARPGVEASDLAAIADLAAIGEGR